MKATPDHQPGNHRWYLLGLSAATSTLVSAIPFACMPVLFPEITKDLGLDLVQMGAIWGIAGLSGIFVSLAGGIIGDRFGLKRVLIISCVLVGITGALRGISTSFAMLTAFVFANGIVRAIIPITVTKAITTLFRGRNLGMAQGVGAMGMGLGLMLGPLISATVMSPWLGGWRHVMYFYGGVSAAVAVLWFFVRKQPDENVAERRQPLTASLRQDLPGLIKNKGIWLLGITLLFRMGGINGMTGYLPTYLANSQGWPEASADATLAVFYAVSTAAVIPISTLSDRIGRRKAIMVTGIAVMTVGLALLSFVGGPAVWVIMAVSGLFMDSFMAIIVTLLMEIEGVGIQHAGIALGMMFTLAPIGGALAPPIGNSLARINPGFPFIFWAGMSVIAFVAILFVKETGRRRSQVF